MNAPLRLVVFDVDGTLIDSQDMIVATMHRAFGGVGAELPTRAQVLSIVGLSLTEAVARLAPRMDAARRAKAVEMYRKNAIAIRAAGGETAPLYPGARAALAALHARAEVLLGVATGKARRGLDHICAEHGLDRFFATRQTADGHPSKPHPSMLWAALDETGVEPGQAVMIGDTSYDIEMGRAAGFHTIGVSWGYHPAEHLRAAGADRVIARFGDLEPALEEMWSMER